MVENDNPAGRPFLAIHAIRRTGTTSDLPGRYCAQQDVWVIDGRDGPTPIVVNCQEDSAAPMTKVKGERDESCAPPRLDLSTKSAVEPGKRDDITLHGAGLIPELVSKTDVIRERDDPSPRAVLELSTKTETRPERDDPSPRRLLEFLTKTATVRERDD